MISVTELRRIDENLRMIRQHVETTRNLAELTKDGTTEDLMKVAFEHVEDIRQTLAPYTEKLKH